MKNVILVVNFQEEFLLYSLGIELAGFHILKVYCAGEKFVCDYPLENIEKIGEVREMDFEYVINGGLFLWES